MRTSADARGPSLLVLLVIVWAASWPAIKVGVSAMPPVWFACLRYVVATVCGFGFVAVRGELRRPSLSDWRLVAVSGVLQMATYSALTAVALTRLPPGRASVLAFSTPLWVAPLSAWWLDERLTWRALAGVGTGLAGVLVIVSPALRQGERSQLAFYALLLCAAAAWAVSIVFVRAHRFQSSALALAPWQMLVAVLLLLPLAAVLEGARPHFPRQPWLLFRTWARLPRPSHTGRPSKSAVSFARPRWPWCCSRCPVSGCSCRRSRSMSRSTSRSSSAFFLLEVAFGSSRTRSSPQLADPREHDGHSVSRRCGMREARRVPGGSHLRVQCERNGILRWNAARRLHSE